MSALPSTERTHHPNPPREKATAEARNRPANGPGWPRPRAMFEADPHLQHEGARRSGLLPVPWVAAVYDSRVGWTDFHADVNRAHTERLCQVCGLALGRTILLGAARPGETSGPGCHPRCMALALKHCPHFAYNDEVAAYRYDGPGVGYVDIFPWSWHGGVSLGLYTDNSEVSTYAVPLSKAEVRELAKRDPLGGAEAA